MLERREGAKRLSDERIVNTERDRARCRDKSVLRVVIALDLQVGCSAQPMLHTPKRNREHAVSRDKGGVLGSAAGTHVVGDSVFGADGNVIEAALIERHGAQLADARADRVIGRTEDGGGVRGVREVRYHFPLRRSISIKRTMPLDVVRGDVQKHRNVRSEARSRLELERRHLGHVHVGISRSHASNASVADVADCTRCKTRIFEQMGGD